MNRLRWRIFCRLADWLARNGYRVEVHGSKRAERGPGYFFAFDHVDNDRG